MGVVGKVKLGIGRRRRRTGDRKGGGGVYPQLTACPDSASSNREEHTFINFIKSILVLLVRGNANNSFPGVKWVVEIGP